MTNLQIQDYLDSGFSSKGLLSSNHISFTDEANANHYDKDFKQALGKSARAFNESYNGAVLITGKPSNIIAIDFDNETAELNFNKMLSKHTDKQIAELTKCKVFTKKGAHYYFKLADNEDIPFVSNTELGIDVLGSRAGKYGGQLDFAPFYSKDGYYYKRDAKFKTFEQLTEMPEPIRKVVDELTKQSGVTQSSYKANKSIESMFAELGGFEDEKELVSTMKYDTYKFYECLRARLTSVLRILYNHYKKIDEEGLVNDNIASVELERDDLLQNFLSYLPQKVQTDLSIFIEREFGIKSACKVGKNYAPSRNVTLVSVVSSFIGLPNLDRDIITKLYILIQRLVNYYDDTDLAVNPNAWFSKYYDRYYESKSNLRESYNLTTSSIDTIKDSPTTDAVVVGANTSRTLNIYEKVAERKLSIFATLRDINPYAIPYYDVQSDRVIIRFTNGEAPVSCVKSATTKVLRDFFDETIKFNDIPAMFEVCDTKNLDTLLKTKEGMLVVNTFQPNEYLRQYISIEKSDDIIRKSKCEDLQHICPYIHKVFNNVTEGSKTYDAYKHLIHYSKALLERRVLPYMLVLADRGQGGTGKTLTKEFFSKLLGYDAVGGLSDGDLASDNAFLAKQTKGKLLVTLDETQGSQTESNNYTRNLKRMLANKTFSAQAKNKNAETYNITWNMIATTNYIRPLLFENGQLSRRVSYVISADKKLKDIEGFDANRDFLEYLESEIPAFLEFLAHLEFDENALKPQVPSVIANYVLSEQSSDANIVAEQIVHLTTESVESEKYENACAFFESEFNLDDNFVGDVLKDALREIRSMHEIRISSRFLKVLLGKENKQMYGNLISALISLGAKNVYARAVTINKSSSKVSRMYGPCLILPYSKINDKLFGEKMLN